MTRLAFPIILILLSVGLFFGFIDPTYNEIQIILQEETRFDQALDKSKELQEVRDRLLSRYNTFSTNDLDRLTKLLPDNVDNVRLVLDIDNIASVYVIRIKNVAISKTDDRQASVIGPDKKPYEQVLLSFSVTSAYESLIQFIKDIEKSLRIVDVTEISLIPSKTGESNLYEYNIGIKTYWLK